jgi:hypothetical protein
MIKGFVLTRFLVSLTFEGKRLRARLEINQAYKPFKNRHYSFQILNVSGKEKSFKPFNFNVPTFFGDEVDLFVCNSVILSFLKIVEKVLWWLAGLRRIDEYER